MNTTYQTLITISLGHEYFHDGRFTRFNISPLAETAGYLNRRGLLYKITGNNFRLILENQIDPEARLNHLYEEKFKLRFALTITDPYFYNYTSGLSAHISSSLYYFSNATASRKRMHQENFAGEADAKPVTDFAGEYFVKPFAIIELQLKEKMQPEVNIRFQARSTVWKYIVTSEYLHEFDKLAIISPEGITFTGPESTQLPNSTPVLVFSSSDPIKLSERPSNNFSLVDNYVPGGNRHRVLKRVLPAPDVALISAGLPTASEQTDYSEIFI